MVIYSVTFALEQNIESVWLEYIRTEYLKNNMELGFFSEYRFTKIMDGQNLDLAYNIQFRCHSKEKINEYLNAHAHELSSLMQQKFPGQYASFYTLLEEVF